MSTSHTSKTICLTIDIEPDFGGLAGHQYYYGKHYLTKLKGLLDRHELKLTAFVTGKTLEDNPEIVDLLKTMDAEIEQHSYSHMVSHGDKIDDIEKGIETHRRVVGTTPYGYRSPQGIINKKEALYLEKAGLKYDSSIFPFFFPGRFNRLNFPTEPFMIKGTNIIEIPFAVIPKIRFPIGLSYIQLFGLDFYKFLFKMFGMPSLFIFDFHSYELGKVNSYDKLPLGMKIGYFRSQRMYKDPFIVLEEFLRFVLSRGYKSISMYNLYNDLKERTPVWNWDSD